MPAASRLMDASPKVRALRVVFAIGSDTGSELIAPCTFADSAWNLPQHGVALDASQRTEPPLVSHRWKPSTGTVPPWARSYLTRMSPAVRNGVTPLPLAVLDW